MCVGAQVKFLSLVFFFSFLIAPVHLLSLFITHTSVFFCSHKYTPEHKHAHTVLAVHHWAVTPLPSPGRVWNTSRIDWNIVMKNGCWLYHSYHCDFMHWACWLRAGEGSVHHSQEAHTDCSGKGGCVYITNDITFVCQNVFVVITLIMFHFVPSCKVLRWEERCRTLFWKEINLRWCGWPARNVDHVRLLPRLGG